MADEEPGRVTAELSEMELRVLDRMRRYAEENGYRLNPDNRLVTLLIRAMVKKYERFGKLYCPCRRVTGDPRIDKLIVCPCAYHRREIEEMGRCHCGLFVKK